MIWNDQRIFKISNFVKIMLISYQLNIIDNEIQSINVYKDD